MKTEKAEKLVANLYDKTEYVIHIRNLKQALNHGFFKKKVHRVITFNQNVWLKPCIDMNTDFDKYLFKLINNAVFGKTMENARKHRDIILVTTDRRRYYLVLGPNYHTTKFCNENVLAIEILKTSILMNKPIYFGLSIELSEILMYEFCMIM